jgi:hypothetical protein
MPYKIHTIAGNSVQVVDLRKQIKKALEKNDMVEVYLLQPGIMYEENNEWKTVIDFINEWKGQPVSFFSNLVPSQPTAVPLTYTNDMFFAGHNLYKRNKKCKSLLSLLKPVRAGRQYYWDLLLGETRPNRDLLHSMIIDHPIKSKTFMTYFGKDTAKGYWSKYVVRPNEHTAETIENVYDSQIRCSDLIDPEIYNQTYYTAMIETVIHKDFAMFSEKEAKPIVAKRPFIIFGSPGHLRAFRKLGFQSFAPVIDESYDQEEDLQKRFYLAIKSMHQLCEKDPIEVYDKLSDVLNHNKKYFEESKWLRCLNFDKDL